MSNPRAKGMQSTVDTDSNVRPIYFQSIISLLSLFVMTWSIGSQGADTKNLLDVPHYVKEIAYGEILFDYYQQRYFSSITKTLVAQKQGALEEHKDHAELLLGSLYISYGLIDEAESIFNRLIDRTTEKETRDQAWFYLAALHYKRGNYERTKAILNHQLNNLSNDLENERRILNAILLMKENQFGSAVKELSGIPRQSRLNTYAKYNMAVAFASLGKGKKSTNLFDTILNLPKDDEEISALKDKSSLALGVNFLRREKYDFAIQTLTDIRLDSPFANPALLALGWAHLSKKDYRKALTPWIELKNRNTVYQSVQEVYLHIPYIYEQLGALQQALEGYHEAKSLFASEQTRIRTAKMTVNSDAWVNNLSPDLNYSIDPMGQLPSFSPPKSLDAYYLYQFFASHRFNEGYQNYRELQRLKLLVQRWQNNMPVFNNMLTLNQKRLDALTPQAREIMDQSKEHRDKLALRLQHLNSIKNAALIGKNVAATASLSELEIKYRLDDVASLFEIHSDSTFFDKEKKQLGFLQGLWLWDISENAGERYWNIRKQDKEIQLQQVVLDTQLKKLALSHDNAATRFNGFEARFTSLNHSLGAMLVRIDSNLSKHRQYLQSIASEILDANLNYLEQLTSESLLSIAHLQDISYVMERRRKGLMPNEVENPLDQQQRESSKRRTILDIKSWWD